ncbi:YitT family protein [Dorea ammoniilytica]|uniref:YitT family protein n=2 Tax=Dorea ammoniilytica TaxID=2981788 RepID=A0ABT2S7N7_9FIRM|nr:YitT family protein [Dorea ammoniilytica]MCU6700605.1 YitT family protein [Dorea ammoniilytica]
MMENAKVKDWVLDIGADLIGGILIAVGIYNFALHANFPVAGFSGIAIILYHIFGLPIGIGTILLNVPVSIFCYKFLGKGFFFRSVKSMVISSLLMDYVAPLFPVYDGERLLAALCMGVLCGLGYALIFMRDSSTGGQDFITVSIRKIRPHLTLGVLTMIFDSTTILLGTLIVFHEIDGLLYGIIVTFLISTVMDHFMYGIYKGKLTFVVTEHGKAVVDAIDKISGRGATIVKGVGGYSLKEKDIVLCACNNKEMYQIKRRVHEIDPDAFTMIVESNEVVGEGFQEGSFD